MASEFVETKLNYRFKSPDLLDMALKAPHSSERDGVSEDGNRRLVKIGLHAVDVVAALVAAQAGAIMDNATWGIFSSLVTRWRY